MRLSRQDEITRRVIEKQGGLSHVRKTTSSSEGEIEKTFNADGTEVELSDQESTDNVNATKKYTPLKNGDKKRVPSDPLTLDDLNRISQKRIGEVLPDKKQYERITYLHKIYQGQK